MKAGVVEELHRMASELLEEDATNQDKDREKFFAFAALVWLKTHAVSASS